MNVAVIFIGRSNSKISFSISSKVFGLFALAIIGYLSFQQHFNIIVIFDEKLIYDLSFDADEFYVKCFEYKFFRLSRIFIIFCGLSKFFE